MWCISMRTWLGVILSACGLSQPGWDSSAYSQSSTAASTIVRFLVRPSKNSVAKHLSVEKTNIARSACHVSIKSSRPAKSVDVCCTWLGLVNQEGMGGGQLRWGREPDNCTHWLRVLRSLRSVPAASSGSQAMSEGRCDERQQPFNTPQKCCFTIEYSVQQELSAKHSDALGYLLAATIGQTVECLHNAFREPKGLMALC